MLNVKPLKLYPLKLATDEIHVFLSYQNLRWLNSNRYVWTDGLQVLFVFQRTGETVVTMQSLLKIKHGITANIV